MEHQQDELERLEADLVRLKEALRIQRHHNRRLETIAVKRWVKSADEDDFTFLAPMLKARPKLRDIKSFINVQKRALELTEAAVAPFRLLEHDQDVEDETKAVFAVDGHDHVEFALKFLGDQYDGLRLSLMQKEPTTKKKRRLEEIADFLRRCEADRDIEAAFKGCRRFLEARKRRVDVVKNGFEHGLLTIEEDESAEGVTYALRNAEHGLEMARVCWRLTMRPHLPVENDYDVAFTEAGLRAAREMEFPTEMLAEAETKVKSEFWGAEECLENIMRLATLDQHKAD